MKSIPSFGIPPKAPWITFDADCSAGGFLSFYYSESFTRVPIRSVSRILDNKSDPNLETKTYGLFSTCSKRMRKAVIKNRIGIICFVTRFKGSLCIPGYYHLKWYTPSGFAKDDFCLAADNICFVNDPIPLSSIKKGKVFRGFHGITEGEVTRICQTLHEKGDRTSLYLEEIHRAEHLNLRQTGFRYSNFNRKEPFDWDAGVSILKKEYGEHSTQIITNKSPTDKWCCSKCGNISISKSLLKICPKCGEYAALKPIKL